MDLHLLKKFQHFWIRIKSITRFWIQKLFNSLIVMDSCIVHWFIALNLSRYNGNLIENLFESSKGCCVTQPLCLWARIKWRWVGEAAEDGFAHILNSLLDTFQLVLQLSLWKTPRSLWTIFLDIESRGWMISILQSETQKPWNRKTGEESKIEFSAAQNSYFGHCLAQNRG